MLKGEFLPGKENVALSCSSYSLVFYSNQLQPNSTRTTSAKPGAMLQSADNGQKELSAVGLSLARPSANWAQVQLCEAGNILRCFVCTPPSRRHGAPGLCLASRWNVKSNLAGKIDSFPPKGRMSLTGSAELR